MMERPARDGSSKVLELFEEGRKFTEELLTENERLRGSNARLHNELRDIENQYVRIDVPRLQQKVTMLEEEVRLLRSENQDMRSQFQSIESENREFAGRYVQVERQNSDLISLYVASQRLHSTLAYDEVIAIVKDIVINLIGTEAFAIYVTDEEMDKLLLVGQEGMDGIVEVSQDVGASVLGDCARSGEMYTAPEGTDLHKPSKDPIACIPLKVGDSVLGVIAIHAFLRQKQSLRQVDFELFELLAGHAASALYVSSLYSVSERKRNTLEGLMTLIKSR
jgi:nitrate/nitrite-specific signal transduction histidine kinase